MGPRDGQVGGNSQFVARPRAQQGAIVAYPQPNRRRPQTPGTAPNVPDDGKFASNLAAGIGGRRLHLLRIGQTNEQRTKEWDVHQAERPTTHV
jgi:hypothetical protein